MRNKLLRTAIVVMTAFGFISSSFGEAMTDGHKPGQWTMDVEAAEAYAKKEGRPIFFAFSGSDWCGWCRLMDRQVFNTEAWRKFAEENLVLVLLDFPRNKSLVPAKYVERNQQLKNDMGVRGYPTYVLVDGQSGEEAGRFSAGREKNAASFIEEVRAVMNIEDASDIVPAQAVTSKQEAAIVKAIADYKATGPDERKEVASNSLTIISEMLKKDPVLLVLLDPEVMVDMVPFLGLSDLEMLSGILNQARKTGTPIDGFEAALAKLAADRQEDLSTIRGLMFLYEKLGEPEKGLRLLPGIDVLKQVETADEAKELLVVLRGVGEWQAALDLAFHMQSSSQSVGERKSFCIEVLKMADQADDAFLQAWLTAVGRESGLLEALRQELGRQAARAGKMTKSDERSRLLQGHGRIVNILALAGPDKHLSRQYLRHWQFEFANSLERYRGPEKPPARSSRSKTPLPFVPFDKLLEAGLSVGSMRVLPKAESELHRFQIAAARLKEGIYDEGALVELLAFKERYPASVVAHLEAFIEDWGKRVNPNRQMQGRNVNRRPTGAKQGIPLTRARQERNIDECARIFHLIREAGLDISQSVMLDGFGSCFSKAEIISREDVTRVFPDIADLSDEFIVMLSAGLITELRENWINQENRQRLQQQYGTNRTDQDVDNETVRAYRGLIKLVSERIALSPDSIPLRNVQAALSFDLAEFSKGAGLSTLEEYTELRDNTFLMFEECFRIYQASLPQLSPGQYSVDYLKYWFSAVFGASDLSALDVNTREDLSQLERVKHTLEGMDEAYRDIHQTLLGEWIVSQWNGLSPHVKLNVLQSTIQVLGEHDSIAPLVDRMGDYQGLLKEVQLLAEVDGSTTVGHEQAFGLILKLRHTDALEREAGSFSKYLQNNTSPRRGSSSVEHRNNLGKNITKALEAHFEILGITWMDASVSSVKTPVEHWRETPLAYISLRAVDETVDRIASIQIDLHFSDVNGQVVLPVLSNALIVDAASDHPPVRPVNDLKVQLLLDARKADQGEIKLDVVMKGEGILPPPEGILTATGAYELRQRGDAESLVLQLEQRGRALVPQSELNATYEVVWQGLPGNDTFSFPEVNLEGATVLLERYRDADVIEADPTVSLGLVKSNAWIGRLWPLAIGLTALVGLAWIIFRKRGDSVVSECPTYVIPEEVNGVSALGFLEQIRQSERLRSEADRQALSEDIRRIEEACFSVDKKCDIDLQEILDKWILRVS